MYVVISVSTALRRAYRKIIQVYSNLGMLATRTVINNIEIKILKSGSD